MPDQVGHDGVNGRL